MSAPTGVVSDQKDKCMPKNSNLGSEFSLFTISDSDVPDRDSNWSQSFKRIIINVLKFLSLLALLYFFVCSLDLLGSAFRLVGSRAVASIIRDSELLKNPVVGLMIGVLVTVLVQSSSTSTSIVVTMVGSESENSNVENRSNIFTVTF